MSDVKKIVQHFVENEWRDRCPHTHGNAFSYCQPCTKINMDSSASIGEMKCQNKVKLAALLASQSTGWRPISEYKRERNCVFRYAPVNKERNMLPELIDTEGPARGYRVCTHFFQLPSPPQS